MSKRHERSRLRWVTVATYGDAAMANVAKLRLERAEIPCYIDNENAGSVLTHALPAIGGIKLKVPHEYEGEARDALKRKPEDLDDAEAELRDDETELDDEADEDLIEAEYDDELPEGVCPSCHSEDVAAFPWSRRVGQALIAVLLLVPLAVFSPWLLALAVGVVVFLLVTKPDFRCTRCGKRWISADRDMVGG